MPICGDVVFALSQELGDEGSVEDLDQINGRIHELVDLTRRWGPTLADVLAWRDKAAFDLEDLDASPEKVAELESERQTLYDAALAAADVLSAARDLPLPTWVRASLKNSARSPHRRLQRKCASRRETRPMIRSARMVATISRSCLRRSRGRRSCRWAKALRAVN